MENEVLELVTQCLAEDRLQRFLIQDEEYQAACARERKTHDDFKSTLSPAQKEMYDSFTMASSETAMNLVRITYQQGMKDLYNLLYSLKSDEQGKKESGKRDITSGLIQSDDLGNWSLKGVPWKSLHVGKVITRDVHDRIYGALCKLMEYEDSGYSPENIEHIRYVLEDAAGELEKCQGQTKTTEEIWHYLRM